MITRSKFAEQLRDYQIRYKRKYSALTFFSPKPHIQTRVDVAVAIGFALLFSMLVVLSLMILYLRHFWLLGVVVCFNIFLPVRLKMSRQTVVRNRERRLPLSIWEFILVVSRFLTDRQALISCLLINLVFHGYTWCSKYSSRMRLFPPLETVFICTTSIHKQVNMVHTSFTCNAHKSEPSPET